MLVGAELASSWLVRGAAWAAQFAGGRSAASSPTGCVSARLERGRRLWKSAQSRRAGRDQPSSATAAARGNVIHATRSSVRMCSVQTLACRPSTWCCCVGGDRRRHGLERVHVLQRDHAAASRRLVGRRALAIVEVERRMGRQHRVVALGGRRERAVDAAPRHHHRRIRREARLEDLVPAHQSASVCRAGSARCAG